MDRSWEYINRSQTHEYRNWNCGRAVPFLGIIVWDFWNCVFAVRLRCAIYGKLTIVKSTFRYDFWYQPFHNVMISTEWGEPK